MVAYFYIDTIVFYVQISWLSPWGELAPPKAVTERGISPLRPFGAPLPEGEASRRLPRAFSPRNDKVRNFSNKTLYNL